MAAASAQPGGHWRLELDGRPARTPARRELTVPTQALAAAVADEWASQLDVIDPRGMPLTRLLNSALDAVAGRERDVAADIAKYALSDLLCYRAERPEGLVARQTSLWDPVLAWAEGRYGIQFELQRGLMPVAQPPRVGPAISGALESVGALELAALHVMTTLTGSALLALAVAGGHLTVEAAWAAAHVDEDWQIAQWGEDAEASARRAQRWIDMQAAARALALARSR